ncbi:hybrid sensor histidine kinase/response regulator [Helicobacter anseris]|uniref:histidine kinase n=1 Tax=Helicobacter anseris TaxID=375926 RepID=A0A3D8JAV0_9HELI|nr:chemotaxis protein CheW [Helicobacter anseris]RDU73994.1 hybrid sensor histidine kinase/response regulator [Helicobacter anseris]
MDEMQEIIEDFLIEASELVEQLDQDLIELEHNPKDLELLNRIFRVAHTIKGSSSFLGFDILTNLTHNMEDVLNKARKEELVITPSIMDVVLESIDLMKALLQTIQKNKSDIDSSIDITECVQNLQDISNNTFTPTKEKNSKKSTKTKSKAEKTKQPQEETKDVDYSAMSSDEVEAEIERLLNERQQIDKAKRAQKKTPQTSSPKTPDVKPQKNTKAVEEKTIEQTVRVDVKRLDNLMNLIGELVLGKNRLLRIYSDAEQRYDGENFLEEFNQVVSSISTVTTDLQLAVMKTRMLPISKVFNKFPRMIRDLSRELSKDIELNISGEETELDKSIVEEIGDPLVHIIRNSCDHGIEDITTRKSLNKSETGNINLSAYNEGNHIVIKISDDGKGLDAQYLKQKAIEKQLITQFEAENMSEKEAYSLIFKPGFSTASSITNISGRGVGMDVVKTNIEKLNGIIEIESEKNVGTTLKLKIPLTLAIIQALLVAIQEEYYAIPLSSVLETVRIDPNEIYSIDGRSVLRLRNEVLSLVRLADIFDVKTTFDNSNEVYVVIVGLAEQKIGIIVDYLIGQEEIVIKSLGYYLKGTPGIAGATVRGDGKITLIVDVPAMMEMAKDVKTNVNDAKENSSDIKKSPSDYRILMIDDSTTDKHLFKKFLEPLGITIIEANNGLEGIELLKNSEKGFDAILVDVEMPKMDGYTFASEVRKYNRFRNLPIIALTSKGEKTDRMRGIESGMTEYITKPCTQDYLINIVKRNINFKNTGTHDE